MSTNSSNQSDEVFPKIGHVFSLAEFNENVVGSSQNNASSLYLILPESTTVTSTVTTTTSRTCTGSKTVNIKMLNPFPNISEETIESLSESQVPQQTFPFVTMNTTACYYVQNTSDHVRQLSMTSCAHSNTHLTSTCQEKSMRNATLGDATQSKTLKSISSPLGSFSAEKSNIVSGKKTVNELRTNRLFTPSAIVLNQLNTKGVISARSGLISKSPALQKHFSSAGVLTSVSTKSKASTENMLINKNAVIASGKHITDGVATSSMEFRQNESTNIDEKEAMVIASSLFISSPDSLLEESTEVISIPDSPVNEDVSANVNLANSLANQTVFDATEFNSSEDLGKVSDDELTDSSSLGDESGEFENDSDGSEYDPAKDLVRSSEDETNEYNTVKQYETRRRKRKAQESNLTSKRSNKEFTSLKLTTTSQSTLTHSAAVISELQLPEKPQFKLPFGDKNDMFNLTTATGVTCRMKATPANSINQVTEIRMPEHCHKDVDKMQLLTPNERRRQQVTSEKKLTPLNQINDSTALINSGSSMISSSSLKQLVPCAIPKSRLSNTTFSVMTTNMDSQIADNYDDAQKLSSNSNVSKSNSHQRDAEAKQNATITRQPTAAVRKTVPEENQVLFIPTDGGPPQVLPYQIKKIADGSWNIVPTFHTNANAVRAISASTTTPTSLNPTTQNFTNVAKPTAQDSIGVLQGNASKNYPRPRVLVPTQSSRQQNTFSPVMPVTNTVKPYNTEPIIITRTQNARLRHLRPAITVLPVNSDNCRQEKTSSSITQHHTSQVAWKSVRLPTSLEHLNNAISSSAQYKSQVTSKAFLLPKPKVKIHVIDSSNTTPIKTSLSTTQDVSQHYSNQDVSKVPQSTDTVAKRNTAVLITLKPSGQVASKAFLLPKPTEQINAVDSSTISRHQSNQDASKVLQSAGIVAKHNTAVPITHKPPGQVASKVFLLPKPTGQINAVDSSTTSQHHSNQDSSKVLQSSSTAGKLNTAVPITFKPSNGIQLKLVLDSNSQFKKPQVASVTGSSIVQKQLCQPVLPMISSTAVPVNVKTLSMMTTTTVGRKLLPADKVKKFSSQISGLLKSKSTTSVKSMPVETELQTNSLILSDTNNTLTNAVNLNNTRVTTDPSCLLASYKIIPAQSAFAISTSVHTNSCCNPSSANSNQSALQLMGPQNAIQTLSDVLSGPRLQNEMNPKLNVGLILPTVSSESGKHLYNTILPTPSAHMQNKNQISKVTLPPSKTTTCLTTNSTQVRETSAVILTSSTKEILSTANINTIGQSFSLIQPQNVGKSMNVRISGCNIIPLAPEVTQKASLAALSPTVRRITVDKNIKLPTTMLNITNVKENSGKFTIVNPSKSFESVNLLTHPNREVSDCYERAPRAPGFVPLALGSNEKLFRMTNKNRERWTFLPNIFDATFLSLLGYEVCMQDLQSSYFHLSHGGPAMPVNKYFNAVSSQRKTSKSVKLKKKSRLLKVIEVCTSDDDMESCNPSVWSGITNESTKSTKRKNWEGKVLETSPKRVKIRSQIYADRFLKDGNETKVLSLDVLYKHAELKHQDRQSSSSLPEITLLSPSKIELQSSVVTQKTDV